LRDSVGLAEAFRLKDPFASADLGREKVGLLSKEYAALYAESRFLEGLFWPVFAMNALGSQLFIVSASCADHPAKRVRNYWFKVL
jgi:hypothetical protein